MEKATPLERWIMVDVEADGPIPGDFSMVSIGAMVVEDLNKSNRGSFRLFYGQLKPISDRWHPDALAVCNLTRTKTLQFGDPKEIMLNFEVWLKSITPKPMFISDNNGFDWQFVNWYFWHFLGHNPFGHSSTNLGSLYKGLTGNMKKNFKHLRVTPHDHHPVRDAKGNVEAFLKMNEMFDLQLVL